MSYIEQKWFLSLFGGLLLLSGAASIVVAESPQMPKVRKFSEALLDPENDPDTEPRGDSKTAPDLLPPIQLKILVPPGKKLPDELQNFLTTKPGPQLPRYSQYFLKLQVDRDALTEVLDQPAVEHVEIVRPAVPEIFQPIPFNLDARISHLVPQFDAEFTPAGGKGLVLAVFDGGAIRATHREFADGGATRVTVNTQQPRDEHATHVAGTIGAKGEEPEAKGMATAVRFLSYDFNNDVADMETLPNDVRVTNHSYGPISGWHRDRQTFTWFWWGDPRLSEAEDAKFGKYGSDNTTVDDFLMRRPNLVAVVAAGNDRNEGPQLQPITHRALGVHPVTGQLRWTISNKARPRDGGTQGLDLVSGLALCKNVICIGAIHDVPTSTTPIQVTNFSSFGPADDGRIKPDLVANGFQLLSTSAAEDDAYLELSGTSMASPTACGICALLVELYKKTHAKDPTSAEIKAALIHTATDAGPAGPDPMFGWGSINALRAGRVIAGKNAILRSDAIAEDQSKVYSLQRPAGMSEQIRVTVVWIDPPASPNTGGLDDATPTLQNDLDVKVTAPDGIQFFPYSLNRANPLAAATRNGPNQVDNVEVVDASPSVGDWKVEVKASNLNVGSTQPFALVISGLRENEL